MERTVLVLRLEGRPLHRKWNKTLTNWSISCVYQLKYFEYLFFKLN